MNYILSIIAGFAVAYFSLWGIGVVAERIAQKIYEWRFASKKDKGEAP